jgi:hypothetical protein
MLYSILEMTSDCLLRAAFSDLPHASLSVRVDPISSSNSDEACAKRAAHSTTFWFP